ncbi:hypothetical protein FACS1894104_1440 [Actinomycetota bacterium]|nr:hypothetical protein FACS1894104_1440 [Actinomycetota bacterium]
MKRSFKLFLVGLMALMLTLSIAGCGGNNATARPSVDVGQVESGEKHVSEFDQMLEAQADYTGSFSVTDNAGYSYEIEYAITDPKGTIDTTKGKPGNVGVIVEAPTIELSITNTTTGKEAPGIRGIQVCALYPFETTLNALFERGFIKEDLLSQYRRTYIPLALSDGIDYMEYVFSLGFSDSFIDFLPEEKKTASDYNAMGSIKMKHSMTGDTLQLDECPESNAGELLQLFESPKGYAFYLANTIAIENGVNLTGADSYIGETSFQNSRHQVFYVVQ